VGCVYYQPLPKRPTLVFSVVFLEFPKGGSGARKSTLRIKAVVGVCCQTYQTTTKEPTLVFSVAFLRIWRCQKHSRQVHHQNRNHGRKSYLVVSVFPRVWECQEACEPVLMVLGWFRSVTYKAIFVLGVVTCTTTAGGGGGVSRV